MKRNIDIAVISDVHLGTYGCHARELNNYLKSIQPRTLILNGDIFDIWYFKKSYFPKEHMEVVRRILKNSSPWSVIRSDRSSKATLRRMRKNMPRSGRVLT